MKTTIQLTILWFATCIHGFADCACTEDFFRLTNFVLRLETHDMVDDKYGYLKSMSADDGPDALSGELVAIAAGLAACTNEIDLVV